jgi:hypothetical protein
MITRFISNETPKISDIFTPPQSAATKHSYNFYDFA